MKKLIVFMAIGLIITSGFGAVSSQESRGQISIKFDVFPSMRVTNENNVVEIHLDGVSNYLLSPGKPMLPMIVKTIELPFGVKDVKIVFKSGEVYNKHISGEIAPAPLSLPLSYDGVIPSYKDTSIYNSDNPYPRSIVENL